MSGKRPVIQCLPVAPVPITRVLYSGRRRPTRLGTRLDLDSDSKQRHRAIRLTRCTMSDLFCAFGQAATRKQSPYFTRWLRMRSLSSLSVQSARCSRTAHATRASISAAGAPPQRWNDVPRGTMRLPRASKINPVRRDPVSSRDLAPGAPIGCEPGLQRSHGRGRPRRHWSPVCDPQRHSPVGSCRPSTCPCGAMPQICRRNSDALLAPESQSFLGNIVAGLRHSRAWKSSDVWSCQTLQTGAILTV